MDAVGHLVNHGNRSMSQDVPMRFKTITAVLLTGVLLTGCGSSSSSKSSSRNKSTNKSVTSTKKPTTKAKPVKNTQKDLRKAVEAYSDAYLTGDATTAYAILSERCRNKITEVEFTELVTAAKQLYGTPLRFKTYSATATGDSAKVSYTYPVKAIDQTKEPWVREAGYWRQDDC
jgi:ABC-type phosphate/phosphonate transport system substrate-binding protein